MTNFNTYQEYEKKVNELSVLLSKQQNEFGDDNNLKIDELLKLLKFDKFHSETNMPQYRILTEEEFNKTI